MTRMHVIVGPLLMLASAAAQAGGATPVRLNIEPQPLESAIAAWAEQTGYQVLIPTEPESAIMSPSVHGEHTAEGALRILLADSNLTYAFVNRSTVAISSGALKRRESTEAPLAGAIRLAQASPTTASTGEPPGSDPKPDQTVLITAQKRSERLTEVPVPVAAISAESLVQSNQVRLQDYFSRVPGLSFAPSGQVVQLLAIRGLTAGPGNPTVGVTVDDMPYGASTNNGGGLAVPDIDPGDLAHVEVLRGPQGTLYGASSIGGLLKFVTLDPSTDEFGGRVQIGVSGVSHGDDLGYNVRGSINIPLSDTWAFRASGFNRRDPGYIDNVLTGEQGINETEVTGGHFSALWRPSDAFSLKLSALYQDSSIEGASDVNVLPGLGEFEQSYIRGTGGFDTTIQSYTATMNANLGAVELTSVTGYGINEFFGSSDYTYLFGPFTPTRFGVTGDSVEDDNQAKKFTQEVRLTAPLGEKLEWLLGGFYTHESSGWVENIFAIDEVTGAKAGQWGGISFPSKYEEYAAFANLTVHFTDRLDVQFGARQSRIHQSSTETDTGDDYTLLFFGAPSPVIFPEVRVTDDAFNYLVTPRFRFTPDLMVYARLASGYRTGGTNAPPGVPRQYSPDKTQNYEIGLKGTFFDRTLIIDTSIYHIDWRDIQLSLLDPATFQLYKANATRAKSEGIELSVESHPLQGLTVGGWLAWNAAELTESFPTASTAQGNSGDRLPYSSRFSGNLAIDQEFPAVGTWTGFVGASVSYVGERQGVFASRLAPSPQRQVYPAYALTDVRLGLRDDSWSCSLFVNNATNRQAALTGGIGGFPSFAFKYIQPRTVGLSLVKSF